MWGVRATLADSVSMRHAVKLLARIPGFLAYTEIVVEDGTVVGILEI